jgi:hypothetical protein
MAIVLPTFEDTFCQLMGLCSFVADTEVNRLPSDDIEIVTRYRAHSGTAFARLVWEPDIRHFHVDAALPAAFGKKPPVVTTPNAKFREALARFEGLTVKANPHGTFIIPLNGLPVSGGLVFVGASGIRLNTGKTEIDLTGATLTFRRSNIRRIRWNLVKDKVRLDVDAARLDLPITASYLTEALEMLDSAVATYILGTKAYGKSSA